ncbi:MAG TPA: hypothetical protein VFJ97_01285 [Dermatophilaceae bacterium]|nr:hypothetical protein [Dermatophilaceae bacterium]
MSRTASRILTGTLAAGAVTAAALAGAPGASAQQSSSLVLAPGAGACVQQYAAYQVRADGTATNQGAKFKLLYNGTVIDSTPFRVTGVAVERRSAYGNFPGPGYYSFCAQNTGTANTIVTLRLRTDAEF